MQLHTVIPNHQIRCRSTAVLSYSLSSLGVLDQLLVPYEKFAKHVCLLKGGSFLFALKPSEIVEEFGEPTKCCSFSVLVGVCPNTQYTPIVLDYWRMTNTVWIPKDFGNGLLLLV